MNKRKLTTTSLLAQLNSDNAFGGGDDAAVLVAAPGEDMVGSKSKGAGEDDAGEIEVILSEESSHDHGQESCCPASNSAHHAFTCPKHARDLCVI